MNARLAFALLISLVSAVLMLVFPDLVERVSQLLVLGLLAAVLSEIAARGRRYARPGPSLLDGPLEAGSPPLRQPSDLAELERALGWRTYEAREFDRRVRPVLGRLLTYRIRARHGVDPATDPDAVRHLIDPALMELIDPIREDDRRSTRRTADIATLLDRIEAI